MASGAIAVVAKECRKRLRSVVEARVLATVRSVLHWRVWVRPVDRSCGGGAHGVRVDVALPRCSLSAGSVLVLGWDRWNTCDMHAVALSYENFTKMSHSVPRRHAIGHTFLPRKRVPTNQRLPPRLPSDGSGQTSGGLPPSLGLAQSRPNSGVRCMYATCTSHGPRRLPLLALPKVPN